MDRKSNLKSQICELPDKKLARFMKEYGLSEYDATILTDTIENADYFENSIKKITDNKQQITPKTVANWIINKKVDINKISSEELIKLISQQSQKATISDEELEKVIKKVIEANPKAVSDYKSGKEQAIMFLVGQVMRETKGQGEANIIQQYLIKLLKNYD